MSAGSISDERLAAAANTLPTAPRIFQQLSAAMKDPDVSVDDIVSVVRVDASLSARVLRTSNSAQFARGGHVNHLDEAIDRIGLFEVYRLVGAAVASQLYSIGLPIYGLTSDELLLNSVTTAVAFETIAMSSGEDPRVGYTLGLLRPVGRLLLQQVANEDGIPPGSGTHPTAALVAAWEFNTFGTTSTEAVDRLFHLWGFPAPLIEPIRHHFAPGGDPMRGRLTAQLHLACRITTELGKGLSIEQHAWAMTDDVLFQARMDADAIKTCVDRVKLAVARLQEMMRAA